MESKITGLLRTKDRHDILMANLKKIHDYGFPVIILDGSSRVDSGLEVEIAALSNIQYFHLPGESTCKRLFAGLDCVNTEFILPLSDDDLFIPECIEKCIFFLENNQDYSVAQGSFWYKMLINDRFEYNLEEYTPSIQHEKSKDRLSRHLNYFAHTFYAVHRKDVFRQSLENASIFENAGVFFELAQSFTAVALGKVKRFQTLYCIRSSNSPEDIERKYKSHPQTWMRHDPDEFKKELNHFVKQMVRLKPFNQYKWNEEPSKAFASVLDVYLKSAQEASMSFQEQFKHTIRLLDSIFPHKDVMEISKKVKSGNREEELGIFESMEKGIETLLRYIHHWGQQKEGVWSTPPSFMSKD